MDFVSCSLEPHEKCAGDTAESLGTVSSASKGHQGTPAFGAGWHLKEGNFNVIRCNQVKFGLAQLGRELCSIAR